MAKSTSNIPSLHRQDGGECSTEIPVICDGLYWSAVYSVNAILDQQAYLDASDVRSDANRHNLVRERYEALWVGVCELVFTRRVHAGAA